MERTFVMIKPDAVSRKLIGEILSRLERRNFNITAMKMLTPGRELAEKHYSVHVEKPFFHELVDFIMSGPVVAMIVEGENVIQLMRNTMGATRPENAQPGTIRGDYTVAVQENVIHGSDSRETADYEISIWFPELG